MNKRKKFLSILIISTILAVSLITVFPVLAITYPSKEILLNSENSKTETILFENETKTEEEILSKELLDTQFVTAPYTVSHVDSKGNVNIEIKYRYGIRKKYKIIARKFDYEIKYKIVYKTEIYLKNNLNQNKVIKIYSLEKLPEGVALKIRTIDDFKFLYLENEDIYKISSVLSNLKEEDERILIREYEEEREESDYIPLKSPIY